MRLLVFSSGPCDFTSSKIQRALAGLRPKGRYEYGHEAPLAVLWDISAFAMPDAGPEYCRSGNSHLEVADTKVDWEQILIAVNSKKQAITGNGGEVGHINPTWLVVASHTAIEGRALLNQADRVLYLCAPEATIFDDCIQDRSHRICYEECLWPNHYRRRYGIMLSPTQRNLSHRI